MSLKVLLLRKFSQGDTDRLKKALSDDCELIVPDDYSEEKLAILAKDADVFLGNKVSKGLLDAARKLKVMQVPGAGVDLLDLGLFKGRDIAICNSKSNTAYVAEYAVALLYALFQHRYGSAHVYDKVWRGYFVVNEFAEHLVAFRLVFREISQFHVKGCKYLHILVY